MAQFGGGSAISGVTWLLLVLGCVGSFFPALPGHWLLLAAVLWDRGMLGQASALSTTCLWGIVILFLLAQLLETLTGVVGTRWFGGSKWGAWGGIVGGLVGMLFFPVGLFVGPLLGAWLAEMVLAKREFKPAVKSGVGSFLGTVAGMVVKVALGVVMALWVAIELIW